MPTSTGLPRVGELWERTWKLPPDWQPHTYRFVVVERGRGDYWPMRIWTPKRGVELVVDAAYWRQQGQLKYIGPAPDWAKRKAGLT